MPLLPRLNMASRAVAAAGALLVLVSSSPVTAKTPPKPKKPVIPVNGLVAYWPGNGNAKDAAGHHDGNASATLAYAPGKVGSSFKFDGNGALVGIPFAPAFDLDPEGQFTISAWVRPEGQGHYQAVLVKAATRGKWEYGIIIDPSGHFYSGRDANDVAQSTTVIAPGVWYQVAVTYDKGSITTYVNGVAEAHADGVKIAQSPAGLCIGHKGETSVPGEDPDWFQGQIDEVRLYNRTLSADEVKVIYDANK